MANKYLKSGSSTQNGNTFATGYATLANLLSGMAAGDVGYVSQAHAEPAATATVTLSLPGTVAAPVRVIVGNDAAEPPVVPATGVVISVTGDGSHLRMAGSGYVYGLLFRAGAGTNYSMINVGRFVTNVAAVQEYDTCAFDFMGSHPYNGLAVGTGDGGVANSVTLTNCTIKTAARVDALFTFDGRNNRIVGCAAAAGTTALVLFKANWGSISEVLGFDASGVEAGTAIATAKISSRITLRDIKLPATWTGTLVSEALIDPGSRVSMYNAVAGSTVYPVWVEAYSGSIKHEAAKVKAGSTFSYKLTTNAAASKPSPLEAEQILVLNDLTAGQAYTATVEILHDSATPLTNADVWVDVTYPNTATGLSATVTNRLTATLGSPTNHATSTASWTTTGLAAPQRQKLTVGFTPQKSGPVEIRVYVAKPSYTLYLDPEVAVL